MARASVRAEMQGVGGLLRWAEATGPAAAELLREGRRERVGWLAQRLGHFGQKGSEESFSFSFLSKPFQNNH